MKASICMALTTIPLWASHAAAATCAGTADQAVRSIVGVAPRTLATDGYFAQSIVIDPVLHRAWVRVARCQHPASPAMLVALSVPLEASLSPQLETPQASVVRVHRGDAVHVIYKDASTRLELQGTAVSEAAQGEDVSVTLSRTGDATEPERHVHGTLIRSGIVEMKP